MVEQVRAFKGAHGKLYETKHAASIGEAQDAILTMLNDNATLAGVEHTLSKWMTDNAKAVVDALTPIANRVEGES